MREPRELGECMMNTRDSRWARLAGVLLILVALGLLLGHRSGAQAMPAAGTKTAPGDALLGEWWTENNEGRIRFTRHQDGTFRGTTTCCVPVKASADHPGRDVHNPNPKLQGRSTIGIVLIWKLVYEDGEYSGGYVYNPRDGKIYRFSAKVIDRDTVKIRGYMGIPLLGQSQIWKRAGTQARAPVTSATD
jgi:uncharacterized protein (DUF2147 family)